MTTFNLTNNDDTWNDDDNGNTINGLDGNDVINGHGGDDIIDGGAGSDALTGGPGTDRLTGGTGADFFLDNSAGLNGDHITDFLPGDRIQITDLDSSTASITLAGSTLSYSDGSGHSGSVHIDNAGPGRLVVRAISGGGTEIRVQQPAHNDFNGDGFSDVMWRANDGRINDWLGQANGGFASNDVNVNVVVPNIWHIVGSGDFNGDGRSDILWRADDGRLNEWLGKADGGLVSNDFVVNTVVSTIWHIVGTGDYNGDGRGDIMWRADDGRVNEWFGQVNGGFVSNDATTNVIVPNIWHIAGSGDFNGDGLDDVLWRADDGRVNDWLGQPNGTFLSNEAVVNTVVPNLWHIVGTGDFNGDGRSDILWRADDGRLNEWLGQGNGGFASNDSVVNAVVPTSQHIVEFGDFNGDAIDDLLWRNDDGTVHEWLGQSNGGFAANNVTAAVSTDWHVQDPFVHDPFLP